MDNEDRWKYFGEWLIWAIEMRHDLVYGKTIVELYDLYTKLEEPYELIEWGREKKWVRSWTV